MKKWPKDGSSVSLREMVQDIRKSILFAYRLERINKSKNIPWTGYDIGEREKVVAFSPNLRLRRNYLKQKETQNRDALDEILGIAIQLGIEQGRRILKTSPEYQLMLLKDMNNFERLVDNLKNNELNLRHIRNAIRIHTKERKDIPENIKNLIDPNVLDGIFNLFEIMIGSLELAYGRGVQVTAERIEDENQKSK